MKKFIVKRILQLLPILIGITVLTFLLLSASGTDAVDVLEHNTGGTWTTEQKTEARKKLGIDQSLPQQYVNWVKKFIKGDMGNSYISGEPVSSVLKEKVPATVLLMICSIIGTVVISIPLGILAAIKQNRFLDYFIRIGTFIGNSLPSFLVALLLIYLFSLKLGILPVIGQTGTLSGVILPATTLVIAMSAKYIRQVRTTVLEELGKEYVTGARARGIAERKILLHNVLKSSATVILTMLSLSIGSLLGGTAVVETIFMWDGVGKMAVDAILTRDFPVLQAYVVWMAIIFVLINLVTDLLYHFLDPRVRLQKGGK